MVRRMRSSEGSSADAETILLISATATRQEISHHRRLCESHASQQTHKRPQPLAAVSFHVQRLVVQKTGAGFQADAAIRHVALDNVGRDVALAAERVCEIAAGVKQNVAAA